MKEMLLYIASLLRLLTGSAVHTLGDRLVGRAALMMSPGACNPCTLQSLPALSAPHAPCACLAGILNLASWGSAQSRCGHGYWKQSLVRLADLFVP